MTWLDIINDILFWALLYVLLWQAYILLFNKGIPNVRTAPEIRRKIIEILQREIETKGSKDYQLVDLGSGNGDTSRNIAQALPDIAVIGVEISKIAAWRARQMAQFRQVKNVSYRQEDFFETDLSQADAVYIFQFPSVMNKLHAAGILQGLKPSALIICNKFIFYQDGEDQWEPEEIIDVKTLIPNQKRMFLYRVPHD